MQRFSVSNFLTTQFTSERRAMARGSIHGIPTGLYLRDWIGLLVFGAINNYFYVLVNGAAQSLCTEFEHEKLIGAVLWCNIAFGLVVRLINMTIAEHFGVRIAVNTLLNVIGLGGIVLSLHLGHNFFWLCLLSIIFVGSASSFGESVVLCYLKKFPSELVGAWSSGTGFAGVLGTLSYALFKIDALKLNDKTIFIAVSPLLLVYVCLFFFVIKVPPQQAGTAETAGSAAPGGADESSEKEPLVPADSEINARSEEQRDHGHESVCQRLRRCIGYVWWPSLNLILVYFFEYVASMGGSNRAQGGDWRHSPNWFVRQSYVILNLSYQIGVLISRSSLSVVKIKHIEVLTLIQLGNMVFWLVQATIHFVQGYPIIWVLFLHMVFTGLMGGASYVNVFYLVLHNKTVPARDRELATNIAALSNTFGITMAAVTILLLEMVLWPSNGTSSSSLSSSSLWSESVNQ